ncbi:MAG: MCE family protein [Myxococcales bacterium]|nr:MCE family protein [Myxococcales bacterium]
MTLTPAQRARLGAFIVVGLTILGITVVSMLGRSLLAEVDLYTVRFKESVSGLEHSSQVKYQGLRVGRVHGLRIADDDPTAIEVTLALKPGTALYKGTEARLDSSALTGLTTINLTAGDPRVGRVPVGALLPAGMSFTDRITGEAEAIRVKFETLTNQLIRWSSDRNRKRLERLIDHTDELVRNSNRAVVDLRPALLASVRSIEDAGTGAVRLSHAGTRTLGRTQELVRGISVRSGKAFDEVDRILKAVDISGLAKTIAAAESALKKIETAVSRVDLQGPLKGVDGAIRSVRQMLDSVRKLLSSVELAVRGGRDDALKTLKHLRSASEDLKALSRDLARDPALLLRGRETGK